MAGSRGRIPPRDHVAPPRELCTSPACLPAAIAGFIHLFLLWSFGSVEWQSAAPTTHTQRYIVLFASGRGGGLEVDQVSPGEPCSGPGIGCRQGGDPGQCLMWNQRTRWGASVGSRWRWSAIEGVRFEDEEQ